MASRLKQLYTEKVIPSLVDEFKYSSVMETPKIEKIVINSGIGRFSKEKQKIDTVKKQIALIAGQTPAIANAKKSISTFKVRVGMPIGIKATLRETRMYDFLDRLVNVAIPRTRDFSGISTKFFDKKGNVSIGIKDCSIFSELSGEEGNLDFSIEISIVTSAKSDEEARALLTNFGFPFKKDNK